MAQFLVWGHFFAVSSVIQNEEGALGHEGTGVMERGRWAAGAGGT